MTDRLATIGHGCVFAALGLFDAAVWCAVGYLVYLVAG